MKKATLGLFVILITFVVSCRKEPTQMLPTTKPAISAEDSIIYERLGIEKIIENVKIDPKIFKGKVIDKSYDLTHAEKVFHFYDGLKGYIFNNNTKDTIKKDLIVCVNNDLIYFYYQEIEYIDSSAFYVRYFDDNDNLVKEYLVVDGNINEINNSKAAEADCNELGPARDGEDFYDCVKRNWTNFGCDFVGIVTQATHPRLVLLAISIECGVTLK